MIFFRLSRERGVKLFPKAHSHSLIPCNIFENEMSNRNSELQEYQYSQSFRVVSDFLGSCQRVTFS